MIFTDREFLSMFMAVEALGKAADMALWAMPRPKRRSIR